MLVMVQNPRKQLANVSNGTVKQNTIMKTCLFHNAA